MLASYLNMKTFGLFVVEKMRVLATTMPIATTLPHPLSGAPLGGAKSHDTLRSAECGSHSKDEDSEKKGAVLDSDEEEEVSSVPLPEYHCH